MYDSGFARTVIAALVAFWLTGALLYANPAAGVEKCGSLTTQETLSLRVRAADTDLQRGDVAKFFVSVRRDVSRAIGDLGAERSATTMPVAGAELRVGLQSEDSSMYGHSVTDDAGRAIVKFRIGRYLNKGSASLDAFAWVDHAKTPCNMSPREWGETHQADFARIS